MKLFLSSLFVLFSLTMQAQNYKVMTYNIRLDLASDGENTWNLRKEKVVDLILFYEPDIFGIQEGLPNQVQYLDASLQNYKVIGQGRDGGQNGEQSSLFYDNTRYDVLSSDTFWLSETPNQVSKGWDAQLNRICTYALFKNKSIASREHLKYNEFNGNVATLATRTHKKRRLFYELEPGGRLY